MNTRMMPHRGEMIAAFLSRDGSYDGVFFTGVRTTGVFCRPTCPAKKPHEENIEFFSSTQAVAGSVDDALCLLEFADRRMNETQIVRLQKRLDRVFVPGASALFAELAGDLEAYFRGGLTEFSVPLRTPGTEFQRLVWSELRAVPSGTTRTYVEVAAEIGRPTAVRAVARANGDNRIAILIPCHRVVGSDGKLTGYGGGLWRKQRLLEIE